MKGAGSGFIVNPEGLILTNNHVVKGSDQLTVTLSDKKSFKGTVVGYDPTHDLALVKIDAGAQAALSSYWRFGKSGGGAEGACHWQPLRIRGHLDYGNR